MLVCQIPYYIYTSGEKISSEQLGDWKVSFESPYLDKKILKKEYKIIENNWELELVDDIPSELGILILPKWLNSNLIGFVYPSNDSKSQGQRPNITLIGCLITNEIKNRCCLCDLIKLIYKQNDLKNIACLDKEKIDGLERPDYLSLDFEKTSIAEDDQSFQTKLDGFHTSEGISWECLEQIIWKSDIDGYWVKDGIIKKLTFKSKSEDEVNSNKIDNQVSFNKKNENKPNGGNTVKNSLIGIMIVVMISGGIAAYFIEKTNNFFQWYGIGINQTDTLKDKSIKIIEEKSIDRIKEDISNNIISYSDEYVKRNNELFVGIGIIKNKKGDEYEIESFSTSIPNLANLSSFICKSEIVFDIICEEKELEKAVFCVIKDKCKEVNKRNKDDYFSETFEKEPYKEINEELKVIFNKYSINDNTNNKGLNSDTIREYVGYFFENISKEKLVTMLKKYKESKNIYLPADFNGFVLLFSKNTYVYGVVEFDGFNIARPVGEFFYYKDNYYKLPIIPKDENKSLYIKKDGNYYRFGKIDSSLTMNDKEKIIKEISNKYFNYIKEKNKD